MILKLILIGSLTFGQSVKPVYDPPPEPIYHLVECPFCHNYYATKIDGDGDTVFVKHILLQFKINNYLAMTTCEDMYRKYMEAIATVMIEDKTGQLAPYKPMDKRSASSH